jgi:signal transduction histidine kinase
MNHLHYPTVRMTVLNGVLAPFLNRASPPAPFDPQLAELVLAARRKDEFLAQLAHELRSPLAAIQYAARALVNPGDEASALRTRELIERQVRQMRHLIDDVLDVSMIARGRLRLNVERVDLRTVLGNAVETLQWDVDEKHHRLTVALPEEPIWLRADICSLERVFVNLLSNALRYTADGGEVGLSADVFDGEAVVRIRDSGIGIAPDALAHVFELFNQADRTEARSRAGLGIGLAVVSTLVAAHGGSVVAASDGKGRGSEFTVRIPLE